MTPSPLPSRAPRARRLRVARARRYVLGATLFSPSAFVTHNGEALDHKKAGTGPA